MPIKSMDFPVWLGARRRHSGLWQRRAMTPDGKSRDLIGMFFIGNHLIPCASQFAFSGRSGEMALRDACRILFSRTASGAHSSSRGCLRRSGVSTATSACTDSSASRNVSSGNVLSVLARISAASTTCLGSLRMSVWQQKRRCTSDK